MGLEYITQPQVFLQPISALGGIAGFVTQPEFEFPPVTSFYTWTTSTGATANTFFLDGAVTLLNQPGSFIISVGGVVQSPLTYTVNPNARLVTFDSPVPSGVEITVTQIGTVALTANSFAAITASDIFNTNLVNTNLTSVNAVIDNFYSTNAIFSSLNALSASLFFSNITANNILLNDNGSLIGTTSATTINVGFLSARGIDLIHTPDNDGVDPILNIGETGTIGFSGLRIRYEEPTNNIIISSRTGTTVLTSAIINVATGNITAPSQILSNNDSVVTRRTGDLRYGNTISAIFTATDVTTTLLSRTSALTAAVFAIPLEANSVYDITCNMMLSASGTSGTKFSYLYTGQLTQAVLNEVYGVMGVIDQSSAVTIRVLNVCTESNTLSTFAPNVATSGIHMYTRTGVFITSTAGTLSALYATRSMPGSAVPYAGSSIIARRLA